MVTSLIHCMFREGLGIIGVLFRKLIRRETLFGVSQNHSGQEVLKSLSSALPSGGAVMTYSVDTLITR